MLTTIIVQPIFNLLVLIYAIIPGHNFGLAIILLTLLIRILMWPLVKKQLHHAKALRALQPELKKIKAAAKGDKQKESQMTMELYKERQINPFGTLGIVIVQTIVLIGLYTGLRRIIKNPEQIISFSYPALHNLSWMKELAANIHRFDDSLFGVINLGRSALGTSGVYWPALVLAIASAIAQFYQSRQLMPQSKDSRGLRAILKEAGQGKSADQSEVNAAVGRSTQYMIPFIVLLVSVRLAAAVPLYWFTGSLIALFQQGRVLREDVQEAEVIADKPSTTVKEVSVKKTTRPANKKKNSRKKRKR